jgi:hypothetical protein
MRTDAAPPRAPAANRERRPSHPNNSYITQSAAGPVDLTVEVLGAKPEATSPGWEDIHEVSLKFPAGRAYFNTPTGGEIKEVGIIMGDEKGSSPCQASRHRQGHSV